jgi:MFS family permease
MPATDTIPAGGLPASDGERASAGGAYRWVVVVVLAFVYTLNFLDRQLLAVLTEPIKHTLKLSDTQLGLLGGPAFALFYTAFGIPVAWLADRANRVRVIAISCAIWSFFSAACGVANNFAQLALARVGVGIGEAGGSPPAYSIIADYFPRQKRGLALAIYALGVPFGTTFGTALGGWIAVNHGWRNAFIAIGLPGIIVAVLILFIVREPPRGRFETVPVERPPMLRVIGTFFRTPTLAFTGLSAGFTSFVGYAAIAWLPAYLMREKGMSLAEVALYYSFVSGGATALGGLASGALVDHFGKRDPAAYAIVPGLGILVSLPFYIVALRTTDWGMALALFSVLFFFYIMYLAPALTVVQNNVPPAERSTSAAVFLLMLNLIGLGGGPLYVGMISDWAAPVHGKHALTVGLYALIPFFLVAAGTQLLAARAMRRAHLKVPPILSKHL